MADAERQAAATHREVARSADALQHSAAVQTDSATRTTQLAVDRTILAAERTYAAWVRTGLAAMARKLLDGSIAPWLATTFALTLVAFSAFCFAAAVWREMTPRYADPHPDAPRLPAALLLAINGVLMLVAAAAFVGVAAG